MEPKPKQTRVIPESALLHFAFTQAQYVGLLNAAQYFAKKLADPRQREIMQGVVGVLATPLHFSLPSEVTVEEAVATPAQRTENALIPPDGQVQRLEPKKAWNGEKGLGALRKK